MKKYVFEPLDTEEAELMAEIKRGEWDHEVPQNHPVYAAIRKAAGNVRLEKPNCIETLSNVNYK